MLSDKKTQISLLTLYGHIKTAQQWTIIQQYGDWYTGRWWVGCYISYSEEGPGRAAAPSSLLLALPNVTAHPSTASLPTSCYLIHHYNYLCTLKGSFGCLLNTGHTGIRKVVRETARLLRSNYKTRYSHSQVHTCYVLMPTQPSILLG